MDARAGFILAVEIALGRAPCGQIRWLILCLSLHIVAIQFIVGQIFFVPDEAGCFGAQTQQAINLFCADLPQGADNLFDLRWINVVGGLFVSDCRQDVLPMRIFVCGKPALQILRYSSSEARGSARMLPVFRPRLRWPTPDRRRSLPGRASAAGCGKSLRRSSQIRTAVPGL